MQMITRRVNEGLVIENDIHVTVLDICQDYVRLAISSPNNSPPYWEETLYWDDAQAERDESSPRAAAAVAFPRRTALSTAEPRAADRGGPTVRSCEVCALVLASPHPGAQ